MDWAKSFEWFRKAKTMGRNDNEPDDNEDRPLQKKGIPI
jgi:hypothetical protein